jgi:homoserine kinase
VEKVIAAKCKILVTAPKIMTNPAKTKLIRVPASTSNLGPGFDTLGLALQLYLRVEVEALASSPSEFHLEGEGLEDLPDPANSLICRTMRHVFLQEGHRLPSLAIRVKNEIPIARGLGSSAASIVAGIAIYEAFAGADLNRERFFRYALHFENHPDNLTPCRFGGFTVSCVKSGNQVSFYRSDISPELKVQLVVPDFKLNTRKARSVVNSRQRLEDTVYNLQRSSLTVAALLRGEFHLLQESLRDRVHQPFRAPLIPGFEEILDLNDVNFPGLYGLCLSGAGPSVLVFAHSNLDGIFEAIAAIFARHEFTCRRFDLAVDNLGRTLHSSGEGDEGFDLAKTPL